MPDMPSAFYIPGFGAMAAAIVALFAWGKLSIANKDKTAAEKDQQIARLTDKLVEITTGIAVESTRAVATSIEVINANTAALSAMARKSRAQAANER